jgi:hypothetical protein
METPGFAKIQMLGGKATGCGRTPMPFSAKAFVF